MNETRKKINKHAIIKLIIGVVILFVLSGIYCCFLSVTNFLMNTTNSMDTRTMQTKELSASIERVLSINTSFRNDAEEKRLKKISLDAAVCDEIMPRPVGRW